MGYLRSTRLIWGIFQNLSLGSLISELVLLGHCHEAFLGPCGTPVNWQLVQFTSLSFVLILFSEFGLVGISPSLWVWPFISPHEQCKWAWAGLVSTCFTSASSEIQSPWSWRAKWLCLSGLLLDHLCVWLLTQTRQPLKESLCCISKPLISSSRGTWLESFILSTDNPQEKFSLQDGGRGEREGLAQRVGLQVCAHTNFHLWEYF